VRDNPGRQDKTLEECEELLRDSRRLRDIASLKASGKTKTGKVKPRKSSLRIAKGKPTRDNNKTIGITESKIQRRKAAGECYRCAWPPDRKGAHQVESCV